ncbi:MAG: NAD-dependent deacetylase [Peptococcaceae bacterium BICA1-7]|nr:MAG: NAD-dependent deacetylase [Peptococcaceae bacterium BICA1-7]
MAALAGLIKGHSPCFVLSGAGISTESGIPDFRSPGTGLWAQLDPVKAASLSAFRRDPAAFYDLNLKRWRAIAQADPNDAHRAVAALEREGLIVGTITQNIDSLHQKAGSRRVWEVHGHLRTCRCVECGESYPVEFLYQLYDKGENPPRCVECGETLRPDLVLFEDPMSRDYYKAEKALTGCQLLIVAGSSLQVLPVAGLPQYARRLVIINRDPTPWDDRAELVIKQSLGRVFSDLLVELGVAPV